MPKTVDSGPAGAPWAAAATDLGLLAGFAVLHSLTARAPWKRLLGRWVPAGLERSTYVLIAAGSLTALVWLWRPLPQPLWRVETAWLATLVQALSAAGWLLCLAAVHTLGHLRLFGLEPAWRWAVGATEREPALVERGVYARVRHPLYLGFLVGVWAAPTMSRGHLLFAAATTGYILIGLVFEERELARRFGADFREFRRRVPRFWPRLRAAPPTAGGERARE